METAQAMGRSYRHLRSGLTGNGGRGTASPPSTISKCHRAGGVNRRYRQSERIIHHGHRGPSTDRWRRAAGERKSTSSSLARQSLGVTGNTSAIITRRHLRAAGVGAAAMLQAMTENYSQASCICGGKPTRSASEAGLLRSSAALNLRRDRDDEHAYELVRADRLVRGAGDLMGGRWRRADRRHPQNSAIRGVPAVGWRRSSGRTQERRYAPQRRRPRRWTRLTRSETGADSPG